MELLGSGHEHSKSNEHDKGKEWFEGLPLISEELKIKLNPSTIRELYKKYRAAGITISERPGNPEGQTVYFGEGQIVSTIPPVEAFGNDVTGIHELVHIEQIIRAIRKPGLTMIDFGNQHNFSIAEIGARKAEVEYIQGLPWLMRRKEAYRTRKEEALSAIKQWETGLPTGLKASEISREELFDPCKVTIDLK